MASLITAGFFRTMFLLAMLLLLTVTGCGDDKGKVAHTLTVSANQGVSICYADQFVSTVTISPASSGISMKYTVSHDSTVTVSSPSVLTGTVNTDSNGQASLSVTAVTNTFSGDGTFTVKWEFADSSDGTDSGSQVFSGNGC